MRFDPVPTANDFRVAISKEQVEEMKGNIEKWHQESVANMSKDLWTRLEGVVSHMAEKLSDSKAIFRDSLIGNAEELCCMLSSLNVNDDPELERIRGDLAQKISGIEPARLRKDPTLRQETAEMAKTALEDITKSMSAYFGGKNEAEGNG